MNELFYERCSQTIKELAAKLRAGEISEIQVLKEDRNRLFVIFFTKDLSREYNFRINIKEDSKLYNLVCLMRRCETPNLDLRNYGTKYTTVSLVEDDLFKEDLVECPLVDKDVRGFYDTISRYWEIVSIDVI